MSRVRLNELATQLSAHPGSGPLASSFTTLARTAWRNGDVVFPRAGSPTLEGATTLPLEGFAFGDLDLSELRRSDARSSELLDALTLLVLLDTASTWPRETVDTLELARFLLWLETYSGLRCLAFSSAVLDTARLQQFGEAILRLLEGDGFDSLPTSPVEWRVARAWLASRTVAELGVLASRAGQLPVARASVQAGSGPDQPLQGVLGPRPRHACTTALLAATGLLLLMRAGRGLARLVLLRRAPTSVWLSEQGLELFSRHELLGRVVRERRLIVPLDDIRAVEREVRFPRLGLYAGLLALALGTLLGTRLFIDGLRVAGLSFPLIATGLLFVILGVLLDIALSGFGDAVRGQCRLVITTHRGRGWAIGALEPSGVDRLLTELATQLATRRR